ncbi:unnamed protein product [Rotaria sordida]|uniref:Secreted protein n=1 Tax=Rotaria sordida TaxID=392033 RepID=A0A814SLM7_9BILA|nr:unnamed protein product [Rotaria sordida]
MIVLNGFRLAILLETTDVCICSCESEVFQRLCISAAIESTNIQLYNYCLNGFRLAILLETTDVCTCSCDSEVFQWLCISAAIESTNIQL